MHYAISFHTDTHDFLLTTPRRNALKHKLICVKQGLVLVKLGKLEYAVESGQSFWLPFDSLVSLTYTPNTQVNTVEVSSRVSTSLARQGGYVELDQLTLALLSRLETLGENQTRLRTLLTVLLDELSELKPELKESKLSQQINQWQPDHDSPLNNELQLVLRLREAKKQMLSGKKRAGVVDDLFDGNDALLISLEHALLGR
ncbi:AraC family transcriptional regulator [Vibrio sp. JPW-9-11-11]|uniref:AraC family transcriptional regulator n=1 Tax=Vibrio sp. JPW-9-11-11 TaxID=1416532 RepID=UPI0015933863|nr:AraC family transcriptional regulator [Vibrio sp. JPW-9-11-11]NVD08401.1 AraC family transcriptional regulator [Vibrio sp. JPW-9-11-11]